MSTLEISRKGGWNDRLRQYRVHVDGVEVGAVGPNQTSSFEVAPGRHNVQLRIDRCGSPVLPITAGDEPTRLRCKSGFPPWLALVALFRPNRWIDLQPA